MSDGARDSPQPSVHTARLRVLWTGVVIFVIAFVISGVLTWMTATHTFVADRDWWRWDGWGAVAAMAAVLAAIGTIGALFFLGIQAWRLGQQTAELRRQNDEEAEARREDDKRRRAEAERDRRERHFAQARLVAAYVGPEESKDRSTEGLKQGRTAIDLVNGSDEPVYRLVVAIVLIQGAAPHTLERWLERQGEQIPVSPVSILPSGTSRVWIQGAGWSGLLSGRHGAEVAFTDRAGSHWVRRATGQLEELDQEPFEYFKRWGLYGPYDLQTPERLV